MLMVKIKTLDDLQFRAMKAVTMLEGITEKNITLIEDTDMCVPLAALKTYFSAAMDCLNELYETALAMEKEAQV